MPIILATSMSSVFYHFGLDMLVTHLSNYGPLSDTERMMHAWCMMVDVWNESNTEDANPNPYDERAPKKTNYGALLWSLCFIIQYLLPTLLTI